MKISQDDYTKIQVALFDTLKAHNLHPFMVQNSAHAWQVFHKACSENRLSCNELYKQYNDEHIATALNKIFKTVRR